MAIAETKHEISVETWITLLSPQNIALRSSAVMGFFTAVLAVAAEVPLFQVILRTMIAMIIFALIGWVAGYVLTSLDLEALFSSYHMERVDEGEFTFLTEMDEEEEDALSEAIFEVPAQASNAATVLEKPSVSTETINAQPALTAGSTQIIPPKEEQTLTTPNKTTRNGKSRKLVVG